MINVEGKKAPVTNVERKKAPEGEAGLLIETPSALRQQANTKDGKIKSLACVTHGDVA